ncbi:MAG: hypothetical protein KJ622_03340 [Alphaproteobacteria bacterium]|nr:hypothetical protein [Alphaproteobacteria bacterium]
MATSDAVPPGVETSPGRGEQTRTAAKDHRLLDHLAAWRVKTAHAFATQIGELIAFVRRNLFYAYLSTCALSVFSLAMNLLALAGTLKIASMVLFDWSKAIKLAAALGISIEGATKVDVAWIGAGIILPIYLTAGIAAFMARRSQVALSGEAERVLYQRCLHHPSLDRLLRSENFRASAQRAITVYANSCLSLALIPGQTTLCAIIVVILAFFQPMLIAIVLVVLLPLLLLYLVTGRRASAANTILKVTDANRKLLFRSIIANKRQETSAEALQSTRDQILQLTDDIARQRSVVRATKSIPEAALSIVTGCVLATAVVVLASTPATSERLIYLLIGFIMIRFMFGYLRGAFAQIQSIVQNLDEIRFINSTILSESVTDGTEILLGRDDDDELDDAEE